MVAPLQFAVPGVPNLCTGKFRLSGNTFMADQNGHSTISAEDFAIALVMSWSIHVTCASSLECCIELNRFLVRIEAPTRVLLTAIENKALIETVARSTATCS